MTGKSGASHDHETLRALLKVHKEDSAVLISNGFLARIEGNQPFVDSLTKEEREFFNKSLQAYDHDLQLQIEANQENVQALADAELTRVELQKEKDRYEDLAQKRKTRVEEIEQELESKNQYELTSNRQSEQFSIVRANALPVWGILLVMLLGILVLLWFDKKGVDVLVPVFASIAGAIFGAYQQSVTSIFAPIVKDEKPENKSGNR